MEWVQNFFIYLPYFIALIGLLIFVHESGHFLFAKLFKVKVHVFSLGFGPKLLGFKKGETLYKVSLVPVGGYVKMLGEDPSEEVPPEDRGRSFVDKPLWQRFFIIAGGPAMNLIFPLFLHFGVGLSFTEVLPPEAGQVLDGTPAHQVGLRPGDTIVAANGNKVGSFDELVDIVAPRPGQKIELVVKRNGRTLNLAVVPEATQVSVILNEKKTVGRIGISPFYARSVIGVSDPESVAYRAGLRSFDLVVQVDGAPVKRLVDLERRLVKAAGHTVPVKVRHLKDDIEPPFRPFDEQFQEATKRLSITVPAETDSLEDLGIDSTLDFVAYVAPESAAAEIGLKQGDRLVSLDGKSYPEGQIYSAIEKHPQSERLLAWERDGVKYEKPFKPTFVPAGEGKELGIERDAYFTGFWGFTDNVPPDLVENPSLFTSAINYAVDETAAGFELIAIGFKLLFSGEVSLRTLGGPIMIGQLAGIAGQQGASSFFWMMALISLNLGLLNLIPIPVLDGGQIVFLAIEAVTRRPISRLIKEKIMLVGVLMILFLMIFATWNDIARLLVG